MFLISTGVCLSKRISTNSCTEGCVHHFNGVRPVKLIVYLGRVMLHTSTGVARPSKTSTGVRLAGSIPMNSCNFRRVMFLTSTGVRLAN